MDILYKDVICGNNTTKERKRMALYKNEVFVYYRN